MSERPTQRCSKWHLPMLKTVLDGVLADRCALSKDIHSKQLHEQVL